MPQRIPGHFSFEPAGSLAASTAYGSFLEDFLEDIIELALRLRRGGEGWPAGQFAAQDTHTVSER
jgi:hypothetical protein